MGDRCPGEWVYVGASQPSHQGGANSTQSLLIYHHFNDLLMGGCRYRVPNLLGVVALAALAAAATAAGIDRHVELVVLLPAAATAAAVP